MADTHDASGAGASATAETIAAYRQGRHRYEIDHLGICRPEQWGQFAVYCDGDQVAEFALSEALLRAEYRPRELPVAVDELIRLARQAVTEQQPAGPASPPKATQDQK